MKLKITLFFIAFISIYNLKAQTVNIEGNPYSGNPYATITDAITAANNGDVILITGIHTEPITFGKSITLRGTDPKTDIIQEAATPSSTGSGNGVVNIIRAENSDVLNVTIENLGIRNGNSANNGGGINVDKVTGLLILKNLILEKNHSAKNGGGIGIAGSNADIIECTLQNNTSTLDGAGLILAPNNGAGINSVVNIKQSLINSNSGRNAGGIYINGNNNFGNDYKIGVNIENSTISNNTATSNSSGNGGGAIFCTSFPLTSNTSTGNCTLSLVQATVYNNFHAALGKAGLQFAGTAFTNLSLYNSIVVGADDLNTKALNFANTNTTNVVNCILGGLNAAPALIDDVAKNNQKGRTATQAGLNVALTDEGGKTQVLAIVAASNAVDFCTATTGISIPTTDQRGYVRAGTYDAGAYELDGTLSVNDAITKNTSLKVFPNPAKEFIKISGLNTVNSIKIYSILGALEKVIYNQKEINVSNLSSGIHVMVIEGDDQKTFKRIVKE